MLGDITLSHYLNCFCLLGFAVERYILICKATDAASVWNSKRRVRFYVAFTIVPIVLAVPIAISRYLVLTATAYSLLVTVGIQIYENLNWFQNKKNDHRVGIETYSTANTKTPAIIFNIILYIIFLCFRNNSFSSRETQLQKLIFCGVWTVRGGSRIFSRGAGGFLKDFRTKFCRPFF